MCYVQFYALADTMPENNITKIFRGWKKILSNCFNIIQILIEKYNYVVKSDFHLCGGLYDNQKLKLRKILFDVGSL